MATTVTYNTLIIEGDFQTNTYAAAQQLTPDALGLSGGGFVSAYNSASLTDGFMLLNFFDAKGDVIGSHHLPYDQTTDAVGQPKLTELANGDVLVVWDDNNVGDGSGSGIRGSIYHQNGAEVAIDLDLTLTASSTEFGEVDVAALDAGGFAVAYTYQGDVFFRLYDSAGVQNAVDHYNVNTVTTGTQADPQITVLADGAFAVTWTDTNPADQQIKARIFEANGAPRTAEFNASPGSGDNVESSIAAMKNGGFAVVYTDTGWSEPSGITLSIISAAGAVGSPIHVNTNTPSNAEANADVTVLENGFIAVTWTYQYGGVDGDIYCSVFDPAGAVVVAPFDIASSSEDEVASAVSAMLGGTFVTSWQDETTDGSAGSISSQITEITRTVVGDDANDSYYGDALRDSMDGGLGGDTLSGADGEDTLLGGSGSDSIYGGADNDILEGGLDGDYLSGGSGDDKIWGATQADPASSFAGDSIDGGSGIDKVRASGGADTVDGGDGDDRLGGGGGADQMKGGDDEDKLKGQAGDDTLEGGLHADTVNGGVGDDVLYANTQGDIDGSAVGDYLNGAQGADLLYGSGGDDALFGLTGKDTLRGGSGIDTLNGGNQKDVLIGGLDADVLTGGSDKDSFTFTDILDSATGAEDMITDLGNQDFIDLSAIDAKTGAGDQAFSLVGAFTGHKGELLVQYHAGGDYAGNTSIQGDVDGDGVADFTILAAGDRHNFSHFVF
jgi:Ca2+-binding RTX toxin-like protein